MAKYLAPRQKDWSIATQKRISMVATMLGSVKSMKMLGIASIIGSRIQSLRIAEIETSKKLRWIMVAYGASGESLKVAIIDTC